MKQFSEQFFKIQEEIFKKHLISAYLLEDPKVTVSVDEITGYLMYKLDQFLWSQEETRVEVKVDYPADWWEAFKERWFPAIFADWIVKKFPVKYTRIRKALVADVLYPDLEVPSDYQGIYFVKTRYESLF